MSLYLYLSLYIYFSLFLHGSLCLYISFSYTNVAPLQEKKAEHQRLVAEQITLRAVEKKRLADEEKRADAALASVQSLIYFVEYMFVEGILESGSR